MVLLEEDGGRRISACLKDTFLFVCSKLRPYIEKQVVLIKVMDCMHVILHCYTCRLLTSGYLFLLKKGLL